jgi:hypothetical protein
MSLLCRVGLHAWVVGSYAPFDKRRVETCKRCCLERWRECRVCGRRHHEYSDCYPGGCLRPQAQGMPREARRPKGSGPSGLASPVPKECAQTPPNNTYSGHDLK